MPLTWVELRGLEPLTPRCELAAEGSLMVIHAGQRAIAVDAGRLGTVQLLYFAAVLLAAEGIKLHSVVTATASLLLRT